MRRKDRAVTDFDRILQIVDACEIMRLGLADGDWPYIVPVNFAWRAEDGRLSLYFHGAMAGRKYTLLRENPRCTFEMDSPLCLECIPEKRDVTMRYECVMGRASAVFLEGEARQYAMDHILMARHPETRDFAYNRAALAHTAVVRLDVTELTAKVNPPRGEAD